MSYSITFHNSCAIVGEAEAENTGSWSTDKEGGKWPVFDVVKRTELKTGLSF